MEIIGFLFATALGIVGHLATGALCMCAIVWCGSKRSDGRIGTVISAIATAACFWGIYALGMRYAAEHVWFQFTLLNTQVTIVSWHVLAPAFSLLFWVGVTAWVFYKDIYCRAQPTPSSTAPTSP